MERLKFIFLTSLTIQSPLSPVCILDIALKKLSVQILGPFYGNKVEKRWRQLRTKSHEMLCFKQNDTYFQAFFTFLKKVNF